MAVTRQNEILTSTSTGARVLWHLESWGLKRIDAWGVSFILGALVLLVHDTLTLQSCLLLAAITANYWLGYWLNDYFDVFHDSKDEHKAAQNLFVQRPGARKYVRIIAGSVFGLSIIPFISYGWRGLVVLLMNFLVMWAYSAPPLRLKSRPGLDLLSHALFVQTWPYVICMWLTGAAWTTLDGILLGLCFLTSLSGQLNQQIRDFDVDVRTDTNFATRVGLAHTIRTLRVAALAAIVLCSLAVISGAIPWLFVPLGLLALPKLVHQISHRHDNPHRTLPRRLVYIAMLLALLYTGMLMVLAWTI